MAKQPVCERCQKPLKMEDPDPFKIQHRMPSAYLGTVCKDCGKVECYECRGGVGLPCSWCGGEVDGAFVHHFRLGVLTPPAPNAAVQRRRAAPSADETYYMTNMTDSQRLLFEAEMGRLRKNPTTAVLLTLFLGGVGAHHFYFGSIGLGVVYALFCWTFIPALVSLIEAFFAAKRAHNFNRELAARTATRIELAHPGRRSEIIGL